MSIRLEGDELREPSAEACDGMELTVDMEDLPGLLITRLRHHDDGDHLIDFPRPRLHWDFERQTIPARPPALTTAPRIFETYALPHTAPLDTLSAVRKHRLDLNL